MNENSHALEDMWKFIESVLVPYGLMPEKTNMSDEQVMELYVQLLTADMLFRELEQVALLKKDLGDAHIDERPRIRE